VGILVLLGFAILQSLLNRRRDPEPIHEELHG
jgi:hypothetical protein